MGVLVCYDDFSYDVINDYFLDHLLSTGCILGFDRSEHWVKEVDAVLPAPCSVRHTPV
ncbi:GSU3473 family protein [Geomonas subterranea]|uniref:Uncharacterized protein n=1 Tax=Geomonas subterranea TaxID=2847989 RepID=A0ABX8LMQ2_9BACT|nr:MULTISPECIES: hypothetical protein [Geomonas]QXE90825.1 hypothetical protein KP001_20965 [Geomonas subterranea]QXM11093.1 hypothetical protein KP002_08315 [Geomonas subterranea]